jgi:hypothetical protein
MEELSDPMLPRELLDWAISNQLSPPTKLQEMVRSGNSRQRNWRKKYFRMKRKRDALKAKIATYEKLNDEPKARARQSMLHLIGGMARAGFGHKANSRETVSKIEGALERIGWPLSNNTIREYLVKADEVFESSVPFQVRLFNLK